MAQLIGRDYEMAEIIGLLDRASRKAGGVLAVIGPPGSGKSSLLDAAEGRARRRRFEVWKGAPALGQPGRLVWAQVLQDVGAPRDVAATLMSQAGSLDLDRAARELQGPPRRLILIDDLDRGGPDAVEMLAVLAPRLSTTPTAVVVTSGRPIGVSDEIRLHPLDENELATALIPDCRDDVRRALWVASRGLPGPARSLAESLSRLAEDDDPLIHLALQAHSRSAFLDVDLQITRLLEAALARTSDDAIRARLLARLARELLGDSAASSLRRSLADEAVELARRRQDRILLAEVLDARLHAIWDPAGAEDRLVAGSEIMDLARAVGDDEQGRRGLFWRFVALVELGRIGEAESALAAFERETTAAGDVEGAVVVTARYAMLAILRGRFAEASRLIREVTDSGWRADLADTGAVTRTLQVAIDTELDLSGLAEDPDLLLRLAQRTPGHYFEATATRILATIGRESEAALELERVLPQVLAGAGPRWIGAVADLSLAAATLGNRSAAASLYEALTPYATRLVVWAGAVITWGPVSYYLGLLAAQLNDFDASAAHFEAAIDCAQHIGALPFLARSLAGLADTRQAMGTGEDLRVASESLHRAREIAKRLDMTVLLEQLSPPTNEWSLVRDGQDWVLHANEERTRLSDIRGVHYLRTLVSAPGKDIPALDLVAGGAGLVASQAGPVLDASALRSYRRRLAQLDEALDAADRAGSAKRAERVTAERQALLLELRRATGPSGRQRQVSPESERARVNVTRTLKTALKHIADRAPQAAAHLQASLRTGMTCRYDPAPGGPVRWHV